MTLSRGYKENIANNAEQCTTAGLPSEEQQGPLNRWLQQEEATLQVELT